MAKEKQEKRTYSTGSIRDLGEGRWRLYVSVGKGLGGKRRRPSKVVEAKNKREAERLLKKFIAEVESSQYVEKMTLNGLLDLFLEEKVSTLAPRTQVWYVDFLRRTRGALGDVQLAKLTPRMINRFYAALADPETPPFCTSDKTGKPLPNGLSGETILHHHRALVAALNWGYKNELIERPIADKLDPPSSDTGEKRALTDAEIERFMSVLSLKSIRIKAFYALALATGMRREELCALEWKHIDFPAGKISIEQAMIEVRGKIQIGPTKNPKSVRKIDVDPDAMGLLKEWRAEQVRQRLKWPGEWSGGDFVFTTKYATPVSLNDASRQAVKIFKEANIEGVSLHNLRHTCVTQMLAAGIPASDVAAYVGHASTQMTLDVYGHAAEEYSRRCAETMNGFLKIGARLAHGEKT